MSDYISKFTGAEIDASIQKAKEISKDSTEINTSLDYVDTVKDDIKNLKDGEIASKKADGSLEGSGIINDQDKIFFPKDGRFPSASIDVGPATTISENGGWMQYLAKTTGKKYIFLDYEIDKSGTLRPAYWERAAEKRNIVINSDDTQDMTITSLDIVPSADEQVNELYFNFTNEINNLRIKITSKATGQPIKFIPSENAWRNGTGGINVQSGVQPVLFGKPISLLTTYNLTFEFIADSNVILKGDGTKPYIKVDRQLITKKGVLLVGEGDSGASTTFLQLTDTPSNYNGKSGFSLKVKQTEDGVDFYEQPEQATKDLSNVNNAVFKTKSVAAGMLQQDLEDVDIAKLDDKMQITDTVKALNREQASISTEVGRLKTNIGSSALPTYAYRGREVPSIPATKYKAYYIHFIVLRDSSQVMTIPSGADEGTVFSVENNDRNDTIALRAPAGETINGSTTNYQCDSDTLSFFVKTGTDWVLAFGGVFPNSITSLISTIRVKLTGSLNTIEEIQAQLKDRLHTFREIQNEFSDQLHTYADLDSEGYIKGIDVNDQRSNFFLEMGSLSFGPGFTALQDPNDDKKVMVDYSGDGVSFQNTAGESFSPSLVKSELNDIEIHKVTAPDGSIVANLNIAPNFNKQDHAEGILDFLGYDELLNSKRPKSRLYFSDTRVKGGSFVYRDMQDKSYVLQDVDPQDDPNISGGTTFIVGIYIEPSKDSTNKFTQNGFVDIDLVDDKGILITDTNGNPMGTRIEYKTGEVMRPELYLGECQMKGETKVHPRIRAIFPNEEIISIGANSCVMFQSITKEESSGNALISFMAFTGYRISYYTKYFGTNSMNLSQFFVFPEPEKEIENDVLSFGDGTFLSVKTKANVSIQNYKLNIKDNGNDLPVFSLIKRYNRFETNYIKGKNYKVTIKLEDKSNGFYVDLLKYSGTETTAPVPEVLRYDNGTPVFPTGWTSVDSMFISEDVIVGEHEQSKEFTLPSDGNELAIVLYAVGSSIPLNLVLSDLEGDITPWFNKNIILNNSHLSEEHLRFSSFYYQFWTYTPSGLAGFRYTVNDNDTKIPWGIIKNGVKGDEKIVNAGGWHSSGNTWNVEGDGEFKEDMKVVINYYGQIFNESSTDNTVSIRIAKVNSDGTFTDVSNSEHTGTIKANTTKAMKISKTNISLEAKKGEKYRILAKSNIPDGFYFESFLNSAPLFQIDIKANETAAIEDDVDFLMKNADEVVFIENGAPVDDPAKYKIRIDVATNQIDVVKN